MIAIFIISDLFIKVHDCLYRSRNRVMLSLKVVRAVAIKSCVRLSFDNKLYRCPALCIAEHNLKGTLMDADGVCAWAGHDRDDIYVATRRH